MFFGKNLKPGRYLAFTVIFWLAADVLMFLGSLNTGHWEQVMIRFYYLPIVGFLFTAAMTLAFQSDVFRRLGRPAQFGWAVAASIVAAVLTATILNPVTFLLLGLDISERHFELMSAGMVSFAIYYLFWSVLYFQLDGRPLLGPVAVTPSKYIDRIGVDDRGKIHTISATDVECITASGDYVEIHAGDKSYLKKETISALETLLNPAVFVRVHRSAIINSNRIKRLTPKGSGTFDILLKSGRVLTSSRSYRPVIQSLRSKI